MHRNTEPSIVQHRSRQPGRAGGFTLIELLMVIVILSIAAAIVVPMASSAASMQLRSAVNMVAADLEYAKSLAIGTGQSHSVQFLAGSESYEIFRTADANDVRHPVTRKKPYVISFAQDGRLGQVTIVSAVFDGTDTVSFDYLGSPAPNGGNIILEAGGVSRTVSVEPVTGFVSISD